MPNRRQLLSRSAGLIAVGLAGCLGSNSNSETTTSTNESTETETPTNTTASETEEGIEPYTVTVEPNPSYTFEEVPETYATIPSVWMDIGMALGIQPSATASLKRAPLKFYELLPGVSFDESEITKLAEGSESGFDKENFYAADCDVHLIDRRMLKFYANWDESDLDEISTSVGPFLGSSIRFASTSVTENEPYYDLYGAFEKGAKIFQRQDRFEAWQSLHDDFMSEITSELPPEDERPTVAAIWRGVNPDSGKFRIAPLHPLQNNTLTYRRLGMRDAFAGRVPDGPIGYEELLDVDPDYIGAVGGLTSLTHEEFVNTIVEPFENNQNAKNLTAVQEKNLVRTAGQFMGPIVDLFATEALAKMVYPDTFGEWPGSAAEIPESERLFDRQRVSDIINGNN
ncbi:ABC transporter substrate-binding protein [Haloferax mediterranei ATCC 33500]|uniref:ABC transporter substrate-binding protein n=1 Tax=Haloferax mediterranei (strain ATCC 33500 / DSM 1411 / JCM 8866 / NBRC 14739 / NCIMB 2177 / R-4) TaxID=523841 RepID=I3R6K2_HALMT|nr:ABC transporter substrate-binding protein [Haloferax mediterranei]AFK19862.1 putative ABC-type transport system substrate-binding protein (substrate iron/cobalamin) [Haloferax mediterranei ATCC 33500]AHZ23245.1 ferrichrome ABC transporter substrate-binding protein [Haloferax mediterranei ATCC 33500]ELZ99829.1 putative ABC-type transport system substrate-binding protein (substrate iron/cobalamin) [Haloferax mediterranei ATCC 33500]MDX5987389.1 ABC transporter substrate-binding protein [Halofe